ncbi:MAG TPA: hypothetical protein VFK24_06910 [Gammaproteobacteria bacterium]|nr:hypothetical protein [Gammaproteobacteria bacterium]
MKLPYNISTGMLSGILFVAGGLSFFVSAAIGEQNVFYALGAVFIVIGVGHVKRAKASAADATSK